MKINEFKKIILFFFVITLILVCFYVLYLEYQKSLINLNELFFKNSLKLLLILFLYVVFLNSLSFRTFFYLKRITLYSENFLNWSKVFYITSLMNIVFFGTGHITRILYLKKNNIGIKDYSVMMIILFIITFITYLFCFFFELFILTNEILYFILILSLYLLVISFLFLISILKKNNYLKNNFNFFLNSIKKYYSEFENIFKKKIFLLKIIIITSLIHILELIIFLMISSVLISDSNLFKLFVLFFIYFILNRIPFFSNIPGINEIVIGYFGFSLGFYFFESAMINLLMRFFFIFWFITKLYYFVLIT